MDRIVDPNEVIQIIAQDNANLRVENAMQKVAIGQLERELNQCQMEKAALEMEGEKAHG